MNLEPELLRELFHYNPVTGELFWKPRPGNPTFNTVRAGKKAGTESFGYVRVKVGRTSIAAHNIAWIIHTGESLPEGLELDHRDGNGINNSFVNLRVSSKSQNCLNRGLRADSGTKIKNVTYDKERGKYKVRLMLNGKRVSFGRYKDPELAELVAIEAREKYHKEYARHI